MMRKVLLTLALSVSMAGFAQVLTVESVTKVNAPASASNKVAAVSPQGDYLLLTTDYNRGLSKLDLATGAVTVLTDAQGAGYDVNVSADGKNVVYRETSLKKNHMRQTEVKSLDLTTNSSKTMVKPTRDLRAVAVKGNTVASVKKAEMKTKALDGKAEEMPVLWTTQNYQLMFTSGGTTRELAPLGKNVRYIWPQLSPDGTKAMFFVSGNAAYVCNTDGSGLKKLGALRAAKWLDNNTVVGMDVADNGEVFVKGEIVAMNLQGDRQVLTDESMIAMYPQVAPGKIAFTTNEGEVYLINVK